MALLVTHGTRGAHLKGFVRTLLWRGLPPRSCRRWTTGSTVVKEHTSGDLSWGLDVKAANAEHRIQGAPVANDRPQQTESALSCEITAEAQSWTSLLDIQSSLRCWGRTIFEKAMRWRLMPVLGNAGEQRTEELFEVMRVSSSSDATPESVARALLGWFTANGGLFTKMGQAVAEQSDMADGPVQEAFRKMQTECPPVPCSQIKGIIRSAISVDQLHEKPLGTGSVAQVHRWGDDAVVKVALLDNRDLMVRQNETLQKLAADSILCKTPIADVAELAKGSLGGFLEEFNMETEAKNMEKVRQHCQGFRGSDLRVRLPQVHLFSQTMLLMSFENGKLYNQLPKEEQLRALQTIFTFCGHCIFQLRMAYCDVHPGNLMLDSASQEVVVLDWGMVVHLTNKEHAALRTIFSSLPISGKEGEDTLKVTAPRIAAAMRDLGFETERNTDEGLVMLARHAFDSDRPTALKAMKDKSYGSKDDPPARGKTFPSSIAGVLRLRSMLGGLRAQLEKRFTHPASQSEQEALEVLEELNTLKLWKPMAMEVP